MANHANIGRPPAWTRSRSRKLARLYMLTTLPVEKIIKAIIPDEEVQYVYPKAVGVVFLCCRLLMRNHPTERTRRKRR
jgi:hypothetical protein